LQDMTETNGTRSDAPGPDPDRATPGHFRAGPVVMLAIAAVIVIVDQVTKLVAVAELEGAPAVDLVGETVRLVLLRNPGAAFSLGTDATVVLSLVATAVVLGLLSFSRRIHSSWWAWGLGLILGGAAGNLVDRFVRSPGVLRGHVVDFVSVGWWPVFNVADSCLVAGLIVLAVTVLRGIAYHGCRGEDGKRGWSGDVWGAHASGPRRPRGTAGRRGGVPARRHLPDGRRRPRRRGQGGSRRPHRGQVGQAHRHVVYRGRDARATCRTRSRRGTGRGDDGHLLGCRHRRRRQARRCGRARLGGVDRAHRDRRPGRRRVPHLHLRPAGAQGDRPPPGRGDQRSHGCGGVGACIHAAQAGVPRPHGGQDLSRARAGAPRPADRDHRRPDRSAHVVGLAVRRDLRRQALDHPLRDAGGAPGRHARRGTAGDRADAP